MLFDSLSKVFSLYTETHTLMSSCHFVLVVIFTAYFFGPVIECVTPIVYI
uniref:Uncharacterized protein n=1 Tax=Arundo donax TaxID=35708 RepID=A0A0A9HHC7_ARUDO